MTQAFDIRVLIAGIVLSGLAACSPSDEPVNLGYIEADWTYVAAPAAGRIVEQPVKEGDRIEQGDFLFRLDSTAEEAAVSEASSRLSQAAAQANDLSTGARPPEIKRLQAQLAAAKARLVKATSERDRILPLVEQGYAPKSQRDTVEAEFDAATAAVHAAEQDLKVAALPARDATREAAKAATQSAEAAKAAAEYRLNERRTIAPAKGRIEEVFFRTGEFVTPGTPIIAILPNDGLKARFYVPETDISKLKVGETVSLTADGLPAPVKAEITFIAHEAEFAPPVIYARHSREKMVFMVEARVPADIGLHPGLPVEVNW
ncbi:HlyD family secretion protein [Hyphomonas sp.]|uniref:HlyD family secretion protein n=1 Tax=Hyphomonas sp. TaxID=87 RepID=UPI003527F309